MLHKDVLATENCAAKKEAMTRSKTRPARTPPGIRCAETPALARFQNGLRHGSKQWSDMVPHY
jgi:hypothetical protein